jgi:hypothetical protein
MDDSKGYSKYGIFSPHELGVLYYNILGTSLNKKNESYIEK